MIYLLSVYTFGKTLFVHSSYKKINSNIFQFFEGRIKAAAVISPAAGSAQYKALSIFLFLSIP